MTGESRVPPVDTTAAVVVVVVVVVVATAAAVVVVVVVAAVVVATAESLREAMTACGATPREERGSSVADGRFR